MTEQEKMLAGELYLATDPTLVQARTLCKDLCYDYNMLRPSRMDQRTTLLHKLLGHIAGDLLIEQPFWCDYGYNISIGKNFYANHGLTILDCAPVTFGDNVFIAPGCGFFTAGHPIDAPTRNSGYEYARPITVGNNVWFGGNVTVLPGVTIGDNCVIGAGSVVVRDIPAGSVAVGNPCRRIRSAQADDETLKH